MIRQLYDWTISLAEHPRALWALALVAFVESSVFPIPPDILMIPMIIATPRRAFTIAGVAMVASVLGGMLGYYIGWGLFESVGRPVLEFYGKQDAFDTFSQSYNRYGAWAVLVAGVTPFPYKVVTIASGATGLDLATFAVASAASRGARFFLEAALLWYVGPPIRRFIERNLRWAATAFFVVLLGGFAIYFLARAWLRHVM